jgi:hypothetical protein
MSWVPLIDLKESNLIEVVEYAIANKISEEPAFAWWTRQVLKKRDRMTIDLEHLSMGSSYQRW